MDSAKLKRILNVAEMRRAGAAHPAAPGLRVRRRRSGGRVDARGGTNPPSTTSSSCRGRCAARRRAISRSSFSAKSCRCRSWSGRPAFRACSGRTRSARSARAATKLGTAFCLSHGSVCTIEELAATGAAPRWMQVFVYRDRGLTREFTERAQATRLRRAGADDRQPDDRQPRARRPERFYDPAAARAGADRRDGDQAAVALPHAQPPEARHVRELRQARRGRGDERRSRGGSHRCSTLRCHWRDVDEIRSIWSGPLILKGVLNPQEAREALSHGVDGVIVSNHGGRQLDGAASGDRGAAGDRRARSPDASRCSSTAACGAARMS